MPPPIVEFQNVSKVYRAGLFPRRAVWALRHVSLAVPQGAVFGLIGPNRAGKTTLVKTLLSICSLTEGTIQRLGRPWKDRSTLAAVGYLHESQSFPRYLTATALLHYYGSLSLVPATLLARRVPQLLAEVDLADRAAEPIARFSKGMVQRLALAQALVNDPDLLVLDEPAEGMDLLARKLLDEVILRRRDRGKTAILVSHSMADVSRLCDEVGLLRAGQVAFAGHLRDLLEDAPADFSAETLQAVLEPLYAGASL